MDYYKSIIYFSPYQQNQIYPYPSQVIYPVKANLFLDPTYFFVFVLIVRINEINLIFKIWIGKSILKLRFLIFS